MLIDFGLARVAEDARLTQTGFLLGTPGYLAPEILYGDDATPASDVHAWAATVVFAATGRAPYGRGPSMAVLDRVRRGEHDLSGVPEPMAGLLRESLAPESWQRPSLPEVRAWLEDQRVRAVTAVQGAATPPTAQERELWTRPFSPAARPSGDPQETPPTRIVPLGGPSRPSAPDAATPSIPPLELAAGTAAHAGHPGDRPRGRSCPHGPRQHSGAAPPPAHRPRRPHRRHGGLRAVRRHRPGRARGAGAAAPSRSPGSATTAAGSCAAAPGGTTCRPRRSRCRRTSCWACSALPGPARRGVRGAGAVLAGLPARESRPRPACCWPGSGSCPRCGGASGRPGCARRPGAWWCARRARSTAAGSWPHVRARRRGAARRAVHGGRRLGAGDERLPGSH